MSVLRVAYLVNQYPLVSHSFIRREIAALEGLGVTVARFSIRRTRPDLPDAADQAEWALTTALLEDIEDLPLAAAYVAVRMPLWFLRALATAVVAGLRSDRGVGRHLAYLCEACLLLGHLQRRGVQHVHAHFATNSAMVAMLCRLLGGPPYSFTAHGPDDFDRARKLGLAAKIRHARFATSVSEYGRAQLQRWCDRADQAKIHVVPMGVDAAFFSEARSPIPGSRRMVCVARLDEQKGHAVLLEAMARLGQDSRCELTLIGDGPLRDELEQQVLRLGLAGHVKLAGALPAAAIREHLMESRLLVLASRDENLPVAIMEAYAMHRPVIATKVGAVAELVEEGVTGWLVPPGDATALAAAIRSAMEAPASHLEAMAAEGTRRVRERHDTRHGARMLVDLFSAGEKE